MTKPFISLTSDFGVQSQGIGNMEGVILSIIPEANVVHLMHGLPDFDLRSGARTMEAVKYLPVGCHVCVVDPGVGTARKAIIVKTKRGDYLVGPDNGVLIPAARILGVEKVVQITKEKYMILPVSPIFHGRHIFSPAAAYLAKGVSMDNFGPQLKFDRLIPAPYEEAVVKNGEIQAEVIHINKFGSPHFNILHEVWDSFGMKLGQKVKLRINIQEVELKFVETFGQVPVGEPLIMKDDYGRVEAAVNQGSFVKQYNIKIGDKSLIHKMFS